DAAFAGFNQRWMRTLVRRALDELRNEVRENHASANQWESREQAIAEAVRRAAAAARRDEPTLRRVVNATGVVIHTNLGRSRLAESAIAAMAEAARSPVNLEYDLSSGERGERDNLVEEQICALTGAEAAAVVNNNAAAVLIVLNTLAQAREVIVSRGELVEIGGAFRIPDVMARSGARLREVGTTNRTHAPDYIAAINPETALLMKVHPSNYRIVGFTSDVELEELAEIGKAHGLPVIEDLGSGALIDLQAYGLPREPIVAERIAAGAALVTFSGDKLLGGPQAGLIAGRRDLIELIRRNPLRRALRCDKLTLAALEATLRLYLRSDDVAGQLPTLRMLVLPVAELERRAEVAREMLAHTLGAGFTIEVVPSTAEIGSGALPAEPIESRALRVRNPAIGANALAAMLRCARPAVIGRIRDDAVYLDMRTIEDPQLLAISLPQRPV
ncbi:MAG TPA: L-seryl-tRNA(Sec) selenium transferase, partial [Candidatus Binataceae bacterium]|nr:L-seryl-tRNA(Sec) selenium transferase [Candidatus Binataceae bacterium]